MRGILSIIALIAVVSAAQAFGIGKEGYLFGRLGSINKNSAASPPPPGCASPTAPNGQIDLSQCSNAFYVAVILY